MKPVIKFLVCGLLLSWLTYISCKKEDPDFIDIEQNNHSPRANAGPDQSITLPKDTIDLNGSGSDDFV